MGLESRQPEAASGRGWTVGFLKLLRFVCVCVCCMSVHCRNVHPTTRLLQPFSGSESLPPGILLISSRGVHLCTCLGGSLQQPQQQQASWQQDQATSSSAAALQAAAASAAPCSVTALCVRQHELVCWALRGLPLSCVFASDGCLLVGDSRAGEDGYVDSRAARGRD